MTRARLAAALSLALPLAATGAASAHAAGFRDRVLRSSKQARIASRTASVSYWTSDGTPVAVSFGNGATRSTALAQSYVDFLGHLPHGSELRALRVQIVAADAIVNTCGGQAGTLACYDGSNQTMYVPDSGLDSSSYGITTAYVIAHEYGHHIANHRNNAPFPALDYGPKYWASYERVCSRTIDHQLAPGNEDSLYWSNPGEAWAETYAHLVYPNVPWQFTNLLAPNTAAYAAARRDVLHPWTGAVTRTFTARITSGTARTRTFHFVLHLDGALRVRLSSPHASRYKLALRSGSQSEGSATTRNGAATIAFSSACREQQAETVTAAVTRQAGAGGPVALRVTYAG